MYSQVTAPQYTDKHGLVVLIDANTEDVDPSILDGIVVRGGWLPDKLRRDKSLLSLVRSVSKVAR